MGKFEQIPVSGEPTEQTERKEREEKIVDGNIDAGTSNKKEGGNGIETDNELSTKEAYELAAEISKNPDTQAQIDQLKNLGEKYNKGELKDIQKKQYEDLMTTIRTELDRDVPTVIEMNNEIDINYYNSHPEEAEKFSDEIVNNYENMDNVQLVYNVVSRREYLSNDSKQKLDTVINNVINNLDEDTKAILKKEIK